MNKIVTTARGRAVTQKDLEVIRKLTCTYYQQGRTYISKELSRYWQWYQPSGRLKDVACREILLKLARLNLIELPPSKTGYNRQKRSSNCQLEFEILPQRLNGNLGQFGKIHLRLVDTKGVKCWNSLVAKYHYQGYSRIVGNSLKYIAYLKDIPIAALGWGSAAWSLGPRDKYIGWDKELKDKNLHFIANNIRFLILPGVKIKYLASHLLSVNIKCIAGDWMVKYGHPIYLLETFVERGRFSGTSYKAANWAYLGKTKGYSKKGSSHSRHKNIKDIYVYPLLSDFRERMGIK